MIRKEKKVNNDTKEIVQVLNDHYANIVKRSCGGKPTIGKNREEQRKNVDNNYFIKGCSYGPFDGHRLYPHDFVIAKLVAYGFGKNMLCYKYSYINSRKQCDSISNIKSPIEEIKTGVPQGSIAGAILFNILFSDFFYFILVALTHNFA